jgi:hypothetical protein
MWLITKVGRRVIFMIGFSSQAICMLVVAITWSVNATSTTSGRVMVSFAIIYIWFYNMCTAPYLYLAAGEIPTQRLRSYTLGITIGVGFFWNWLVVFTAPYFLNPTALNWVCTPSSSFHANSDLGRQIRLYLVRVELGLSHLFLLLRSRNQGSYARGN